MSPDTWIRWYIYIYIYIYIIILIILFILFILFIYLCIWYMVDITSVTHQDTFVCVHLCFI